MFKIIILLTSWVDAPRSVKSVVILVLKSIAAGCLNKFNNCIFKCFRTELTCEVDNVGGKFTRKQTRIEIYHSISISWYLLIKNYYCYDENSIVPEIWYTLKISNIKKLKLYLLCNVSKAVITFPMNWGLSLAIVVSDPMHAIKFTLLMWAEPWNFIIKSNTVLNRRKILTLLNIYNEKKNTMGFKSKHTEPLPRVFSYEQLSEWVGHLLKRNHYLS